MILQGGHRRPSGDMVGNARYTVMSHMFSLSSEVRFAVNAVEDNQLASKAFNSYAGFPSLTGIGQYFALAVTVAGQLDRSSSYLLNIKDVDKAVRQRVIPYIADQIQSGS